MSSRCIDVPCPGVPSPGTGARTRAIFGSTVPSQQAERPRTTAALALFLTSHPVGRRPFCSKWVEAVNQLPVTSAQPRYFSMRNEINRSLLGFVCEPARDQLSTRAMI